MIKGIAPLLVGIGLIFSTGCSSLVPKPVELFQKEVKEFPETDKKDREAERQALELTQERIRDLKEEAIRGDLNTNIVGKIKDLEKLADALAKNAGPPLKAPKDDASLIARILKVSTAKFVETIFKFRSKNDKWAGHKIEGSGLFQVPYFVWLGGVILFLGILAVVAMVIWGALKVYATTNPPLALGLSAVQMGARGAKKMVSQLLKGGESFKNRIVEAGKDRFSVEEVKAIFREEQIKAQDEDTQNVVKHLTKKD